MARMFKHIKSYGLVTVSIALVLALLMGSVVPAKAESERVVKIGLQAALTGPLASVHIWLNYGTLDCIRFMNERGSPEDVHIESTWYDSRGEPGRTVSAHRRFKEEGVQVEVSFIDTSVEPILSSLQRDEIPMIMTGGSSELMVTKPVQWVFCACWPWALYAVHMLNYLKQTWTEERPLRVGLMGIDYPPSYDLDKAVRKYAPRFGMEYIGGAFPSMFGTLDTSTEWLRLAREKPDWIVLMSFGQTQTVQVKDGARLEIMKKGIKLMAAYPMAQKQIDIAGKRDCEGWLIMRHMPSLAEIRDLPIGKDIMEAAKRYRGVAELTDDAYLLGWTGGQIAVGGIRLATEQVGVENLSGAAVRNALASMKDYDATSGIMPPVTMSDTWPIYAPWEMVYKVHDGKILPYSEGPIEFPYDLVDPEDWERFRLVPPGKS